MSEFLYICDYLGVTPKEFFDDDNAGAFKVHQLYMIAKELTNEDLDMLIGFAERLKK